MSLTTRLFSCIALTLCLAFGAAGCGGDEGGDNYGDLTLEFYCWDGVSSAKRLCHEYDANSDSVTVRLYAGDVEIAHETLWWTEGSTITFLDLEAGDYGYDVYVYASRGTTPIYYNDGFDEYDYPYHLHVKPGQNNVYDVTLVPYY